MDIYEKLREKRDEIQLIAAKHGARNVRVFGSVARGEADSKSDIDLLVDMEQGRKPARPVRAADGLAGAAGLQGGCRN